MMGSLIWILACPLGMFAMGGLAWGLGLLPRRRAQRLASLSSRATCMPMGARHPTTAVEQSTPSAGDDEKAPAHV